MRKNLLTGFAVGVVALLAGFAGHRLAPAPEKTVAAPTKFKTSTVFTRVRPLGPVILNCDTVNGNDATGGEGSPFATVNGALYYACGNYDLDPNPNGPTRLTIMLADNQTFGGVHYSPHAQVGAQGGEAIRILGGTNSRIAGKGVSGVGVYFGGVLWLENLELASDTQNGLDAFFGANVYLNNVRFGQCGVAHVNLIGPSTVQFAGPCTITGQAPYHVVAQGGFYLTQRQTLTLDCNLTVSAFALGVGPTLLNFQGSTLAYGGHTITGTMWSAYSGAAILPP